MPKVVVTNTKGLVQEAGSGVDIQSPLTVRSSNIQNLNAAKTLTSADCGDIILGVVGTEQAVGTGFAVTLPSPAVGLHYHFTLAAPSIAAANANAEITISGGDANIVGMREGSGDDEGANAATAVTTIRFNRNLATCGDHVRLVCDGTNYFAVIKYDADGSITLA